MSEWLESELSRQLSPVAAPPSLWEAIHKLPARRRSAYGWMLWPVALCVALFILAAVRAPLTGKLREHELIRLVEGPHRLDFHSTDAGEIRAWVKREADIDIDLAAAKTTIGGSPVRLLGARLIRLQGESVAAVDYRTSDGVATLLVSSRHSAFAANAEPSSHLLSWNIRNQTYTIALPRAGDARGACLLCHANAPGLLMPGLPSIN
jgi:anti-sigma factor RsiW